MLKMQKRDKNRKGKKRFNICDFGNAS